MNRTIRQLFLIDALGASLSAIMLGLVLTTFQPIFGMPMNILQVLAGIAAVFAVYSYRCYFRLPENASRFLRWIALANFFYGGLTLSLMIRHAEMLTFWGWAYFIGELIIVLTLATLEYRTARSYP
jgi:hypothetical protein